MKNKWFVITLNIFGKPHISSDIIMNIIYGMYTCTGINSPWFLISRALTIFNEFNNIILFIFP